MTPHLLRRSDIWDPVPSRSLQISFGRSAQAAWATAFPNLAVAQPCRGTTADGRRRDREARIAQNKKQLEKSAAWRPNVAELGYYPEPHKLGSPYGRPPLPEFPTPQADSQPANPSSPVIAILEATYCKPVRGERVVLGDNRKRFTIARQRQVQRTDLPSTSASRTTGPGTVRG